jgi:hypothetical protein
MPQDAARVGSLDIQRELNRLEELILDSPRIPLSRRTMIDEEQVLDQLDLIRLSLPEAFHEAEEIVRHKNDILDHAEQYAQELIEAAERRAAQIMDESMLIRQAEMEAEQIRTAVQQDCEAVQQETIAEIERTRRQAQQDLEEMRRLAIEECDEIQIGADQYADAVLRNMEAQMAEMLRVVRNGRQQLQINKPQPPEAQPPRVEVQVPRKENGPPPRSPQAKDPNPRAVQKPN